MNDVLVTGATGTLGRALVGRLVDDGWRVLAASRTPTDASEIAGANDAAAVEWVELDLVEGVGIERAVEEADAVVHAATAPRGDPEAVDVRGTERLLDAAESAGVDHFVYPSIVGVDAIPLSYYERKREGERAVEASPVPSTVLRATQFHAFVEEILGTVAKIPVWPLPTTFRIQPVDHREVADRLVDSLAAEPLGRAAPVGGPAVHTLGELAGAYREARGLRRAIVRLPVPGVVAKGFRDGRATRPDRAVGTVTWESWLAERDGGSAESAAERAGATSG
ncbi:nmra-like family protein [Halosimplex carlsbadense 2-9-1]|uniref:Nmra-like family protein n=1 Tax=Halosimplex carlsbadense 2-9-1 TaxID=797114 RepID=M0CIQ2_9EURY|nr:SDR family NAD(P)-dependent oxidoreductase [Halosimplex carlsbadense]ELZ23165.1 nmra-like family protein [Halosimplex carlsbadense 2-9-1]